MLTKLTRSNQVTIPKAVMAKAKLAAGRDYLHVAYLKGVIVLTPVEVKARVSPKTYAHLLKTASRIPKKTRRHR